MEIIQHYLTKNPCFTNGKVLGYTYDGKQVSWTVVSEKKAKVQGLMLHSIGVNQPDASVFLKSWNDPSYNSACVHGFIDANTGIVYETLPWTMRGWHCGRSGNNTHIGVEMCEPKGIRYYKGSSRFEVVGDVDEVREAVRKTYNSAVKLFAYLANLYKLDPLKPGVILSHHEGYLAGIASNHGDPEHLWTKSTLHLPYTMDMFRYDVKQQMTGQNGSKIPDPPFSIKIRDNTVWIRSGPGLAYSPFYDKNSKAVTTGIGVFTIVEVVGDFGKLKSGAGWVNLNNPDVSVR